MLCILYGHTPSKFLLIRWATAARARHPRRFSGAAAAAENSRVLVMRWRVRLLGMQCMGSSAEVVARASERDVWADDNALMAQALEEATAALAEGD